MDSDLITPSRSSPESEALDQVVPAANSPSSTNATNAVVSGNSSYPSQLSPLSPRRLSRAVVVSAIAVVAILGIGSSLVFMLAGSHSPKLPSYKPTTSTLPSNSSGKLKLQDVLVNGQLYVNNSVVLKASTQPTNPSLGQLYLNSDTKQLNYFNGIAFVPLVSSSVSSPADVILGANGSQLKLGNGLSLSQNTLVNSGITNLLGTQNQISVSSSTGSVSLGLPTNVAIAGNLTAGNLIGNGGGITNLSASNITSGTVADARLSPNVALLNRDDQVFRGRRQVFKNTSNDSSAFSIQAADGTTELSVNTLNHTVTTGDLLPRVGSTIVNGSITNSIITPSVTTYNDNSKWSALGQDGFVQFAYFDNNFTDLHLVHCSNANCTTSTNIIVASNANQLDEPSVAIGNDGFARIAYVNYNTPGELHLIHCLNADCSTKVDTIVDNALGESYYNTAIKLGSDDLARIVYDNYNSTKSLKLARCLDVNCTTRNIVVLDSSSGYLENSDLAFGQDGFLRIAYFDAATGNIKYILCTNANCSGATPLIIDTQTNTFNYITIAVAPDGFVRLAYGENGDLNYVRCTNLNCTTSNITILDIGSSLVPSLAVGSDGMVRMSYAHQGANLYELKYLICTNADCTLNSSSVLNSNLNTGYPNSLVLGTDGFALIVSGQNPILFTRFLNDTGQDKAVGTNIGSNTNRFANLYTDAVNTQRLTVQSSLNSTSAFQVQNANGLAILTADTTNNSVNISQLSASDGAAIGGGLTVIGIATPTAPTVTNVGTPGTTNYSYSVSAVDAAGGQTTPSASKTTTTGNITLSSSNYNLISWSPVIDAVKYIVYRSSSNGTPNTTGPIGAVFPGVSLSLKDTGLAISNLNIGYDEGYGTNAYLPTADNSGGILAQSIAIGAPTSFLFNVEQNLSGTSQNKIANVSIDGYSNPNVQLNLGNTGLPSAFNTSESVYGINAVPVNVGSGSVTAFRGIATTAAPPGSVSSLIGGDFGLLVDTSASLNNGYGLHVGTPFIYPNGSIQNLFGLYIDSQSPSGVTNAYGIYQAGANNMNFFNGTVQSVTGFEYNGTLGSTGTLCGTGTHVGTLQVGGGLVTGATCTNGADYAENYTSSQSLIPGELVSVDHNNPDEIVKTSSTLQSDLIGVVSTQPGEVIGGPKGYPVALSGRVPVKVNLEGGVIQPGDSLSSSSTPGVAMKATSPGKIVGTALTGYNGSQTSNTVDVFINISYYPGLSSTSYIQNGANGTLTNLLVSGSATFSNLNSSGNTTLTNLKVSGASLFESDLKVEGVETVATLKVTGNTDFAGTITVHGHIVTDGSVPTITAGHAAGTNPTVTIIGNDTSGTIIVNTGSSPTSGTLASITFAKPYKSAPNVILTPVGNASAGIQYNLGNTSPDSFDLNTGTIPAIITTYTYKYFVTQ